VRTTGSLKHHSGSVSSSSSSRSSHRSGVTGKSVSFADEIDHVGDDEAVANAGKRGEDALKQTTIKTGSGRFRALTSTLRAKVGMLGVY